MPQKQSPYYPLASSSKSTRLIRSRYVRFVQRDIRLNAFHGLFCDIAKNARKISKSVEGRKSVNVLKLLDQIIPLRYFGTTKHRKLFYKIVNLILTRSAFECVYIKHLIRGFDLKAIPWLVPILKQNLVNAKQLCRRFFFEAQFWLLEKIVKPVISRFYIPVRKGQTHELELVPRHIWSSFQNKVVNNLESMGDLVHQAESVRPRGILQIRPKNGYSDLGDYRPILILAPEPCVNKYKLKQKIRNIIRILTKVAETMCLTKTLNLYRHWKEYVAATEGQSIYGVKLDLKDAFGNIKIDRLCDILETSYKNNKISLSMKNLLINHIQNQFVICGGNKTGSPKIWKWKHGLLQGDRYSSALCQLYMSYLDSINLDKFAKPTTFIHRTVDDYFFCSTNENEAREFIKTMTSDHTLNLRKTESNLSDYGHSEIGYCGQLFIMDTKQVKTLYTFKKRTEIRHRFKFWNIKKPIYYKQQEERTIEEFLKRPMLFAFNGYRFKNMELNTVFNSEAMLLQNYFEAMIFLAFKFDAAFMAVNTAIKDFTSVTIIIKKIIYKYAQKAIKRSEANKGRYYTGPLSLELLIKIGAQAFILVLKKRALYVEHKVIECLTKYVKKAYIQNFKQINFKNFKSLPTFFNNISITRRLPQQMVH